LLKNLKLRLSIKNNKNYPVVCDLRQIIQAEKGAMDYLAKEGSIQTTAVALLVSYPHSKVAAQFYLTTSPPKVSSQIFEDKLKALEFLSRCPKTH
jgi:ABC-type phosphate transport system permease subunit